VLQATELALQIHGYKVKIVESGNEAVDIVTNDPEKYKIILLDLMMNDISGHDVLVKLEDIITKHDISVIIHSGVGNNFEIEKAKILGAKGFISKPYTVSELIKVIEEYKNCEGAI
jgi:DNA-binding response OmpR family regulator